MPFINKSSAVVAWLISSLVASPSAVSPVLSGAEGVSESLLSKLHDDPLWLRIMSVHLI